MGQSVIRKVTVGLPSSNPGRNGLLLLHRCYTLAVHNESLGESLALDHLRPRTADRGKKLEFLGYFRRCTPPEITQKFTYPDLTLFIKPLYN